MERKKSADDFSATDFSEEEKKINQNKCEAKDPVMNGAKKQASAYQDFMWEKTEVNTLIIYTGGTFGMARTPDGYMPKRNWLLKKLQSNKTFYDQEYTTENPIPETSVTPLTMNEHRIRYHLVEFEPLIDSSELNSRHYTLVAECIEENYEKYDSFIIIYGTDTMGYMASQLSFMFENLTKSVIITGSQIPISELRNDAEANLIGAFTACEFKIPEVMIYFNESLLRGNRTCKLSSTLLRAFGSPNFPELAKFDVFLKFNRELLLTPPPKTTKFSVFKLIERRIALIYVHPLITSSIFLSAFKKAKAIVLETYGMGNFPMSRVDLIEIIEDALLKYNKTVVIVSQCRKGFVRSSYASCVELKKLGAILAEDMTIEAVIAKLSYVLGKGFKGNDIRTQMLTNLRGEISVEKEITEADTSNREEKLFNPLALKAIENKSEIDRVEHLLDLGLDLNLIVTLMNTKAFQDLLSIKDTLQDKDNVALAHLLCQKAKENDHLSVRLFHKIGANLSVSDYDNRTMAHVAAAQESKDVLMYLAAHTDVDFFLKDSHEYTPIDEIKNEELKEKIITMIKARNQEKAQDGQ